MQLMVWCREGLADKADQEREDHLMEIIIDLPIGFSNKQYYLSISLSLSGRPRAGRPTCVNGAA